MSSRNAPLRNRRDASASKTKSNDDNNAVDSTVDDDGSTNAMQQQRMKRNSPDCVVNYESQRQMMVGCSEPNIIEVSPTCSQNQDEGKWNLNWNFSEDEINNSSLFTHFSLSFSKTVYSCYGSWRDNATSTTFVVAMHMGSQRTVCISYHGIDGGGAKLLIGEKCQRPLQTNSDHGVHANLTRIGKSKVSKMQKSEIINKLSFEFLQENAETRIRHQPKERSARLYC